MTKLTETFQVLCQFFFFKKLSIGFVYNHFPFHSFCVCSLKWFSNCIYVTHAPFVACKCQEEIIHPFHCFISVAFFFMFSRKRTRWMNNLYPTDGIDLNGVVMCMEE